MSQAKGLRKPGFLVYLAGLGTASLTLWLVELLNNEGENIMGWYANGIIPAGALIVGVLSGLGYAIGARVLNVKLAKAFVVGMFLTGMADYLAAQWVTYSNFLEQNRVTSEAFPFSAYLREMCEGMAFKKSGSSAPGDPLGKLGYLFKALEMLGFACGTMVPCLILKGVPYCRACQRYLRKHATARLHSPVLTTEIKKLPKKERPDAVQAAVDVLLGRLATLLEQVAALPLGPTVAALTAASEPVRKKTTAMVRLCLSKCPECDAHHIGVELTFTAANGKFGQTILPAIDKTEPTAETGVAAVRS